MDFKDITARAHEIEKAYRLHNKKKKHKVWSVSEYAQGFMGDVGDVIKLIMAKENFRHSEGIDKKLKQELSDCLWSIIIISKELGVDLEKEFLKAMKKLENQIS